jgi:hypothetical protein
MSKPELKAEAAKLFVTFVSYMHAMVFDPRGAAEVVKEPPEGTTGEAAEEWRRVAPRLLALDRLRPKEIVGLHGYVHAYKFWREMQRKVKNGVDGYAEFEREMHNRVKQWARGFGFFLSDDGGMNLDQPLPLIPSKKRRAK